MENNKELLDALKNTIQIQSELIAHLKQEVQRLQASQIIINPPQQGNPPYQPLQPYNPHQPGQPWWAAMPVVTSDQNTVINTPNPAIISTNTNQTSPEVSAAVQAGATNTEKFVPFAII